MNKHTGESRQLENVENNKFDGSSREILNWTSEAFDSDMQSITRGRAERCREKVNNEEAHGDQNIRENEPVGKLRKQQNGRDNARPIGSHQDRSTRHVEARQMRKTSIHRMHQESQCIGPR